VPPLPALRAFADGFVGSLAGGLVYCMILAYFSSQDLQIAGLRVLALSLTFGGFEMWRVRRMRSRQDLTRGMLFTLSASLLVFWALGAASAGAESLPKKSDPRPPVQVHLHHLA
jgi:predicted lipid-binding transport protein (Tim44 family)